MKWRWFRLFPLVMPVAQAILLWGHYKTQSNIFEIKAEMQAELAKQKDKKSHDLTSIEMENLGSSLLNNDESQHGQRFLDILLRQHKVSIEGKFRETKLLEIKMAETLSEAAPQLILQCSIVLRTG